ncbi:hypothetical protein [Phenylobacterium sp. 58.2.17]|uniref:hypothetical protein n=1 Tax=Phenylobacterium sp. 58.2.17 TaxID=2969306 RepID=UPI002263C16B|nr:hypothetical protein [Phenylobacterium sp. 58.2.17]MCX7584880.1 hypothetical protein [Phenylobacterium sp. 58.2.17]
MPEEFTCPIWGTPATLLAGSRRAGMKVFSERAGGGFRISSEAMDDHPLLVPSHRTALTTWLVDRRRFGDEAPLITTEVLSAIYSQRPLRFREKKERFFRSFIGIKPGRRNRWQDGFDESLVGPDHPQKLLALMGVDSFKEGHAIILMLRDDGFLTFGERVFEFTGKGYDYIDALDGGADTSQAFVAMWFDPSMKEAWRLGFVPGIRDAGYEPFRIDGLQHNGKIDDAIVAEIKKSRFLIADFTCPEHDVGGKPKGEPRGGVYYEAGLAHGLGMEVIFTCREDRMSYLHFDTRQFAHIVWKTPDDLRDQLYNRIAATLKEAPGAPGRGNGTIDPPEP